MAINFIDRVPPSAPDIERTVLGSALSLARCAEITVDLCRQSDFYVTAHRRIFEAVSSVHRRGGTVDIISVAEELRKTGELEAVGEESALAGLCEFLAAPESMEGHIEALREKAILRGAIEAGIVLQTAAFEPNAVPGEIISRAEQSLLDITATETESRFYRPAEVWPEVLEDAERAALNQMPPGLTTGFIALDKAISGLEPGQLVIIAGRPSMGKTSIILQIAADIAWRGNQVGFFSIEMNKKELVQRLLCHAAEINISNLRSGLLPKHEYSKISANMNSILDLNIHIDDSATQTVSSIISKARQLKRKHGIDLAIIDHLGLITVERGQKSDTRNNDLSVITRGLKLAAKKLEIPIVLLSQLNRGVDHRPDHRPMLSDLRDSGAIEQDADIVLFVYRDEQYNPKPENSGCADIIIGKQRNGPIGTIPLQFIKECAKFKNKEPRHEADNWSDK